MPDTPSNTPSLNNIYPLSEELSLAEMVFIRSNFNGESVNEFDQLARRSRPAALAAMLTGDGSHLRAVLDETRSLLEREAERISRPARTAAAQDQNSVSGGPTDAASTGAPSTARQG